MNISNTAKAAKFDAICRAIEGLDDNNVLDTLETIKGICADDQYLDNFDFITKEFCSKPKEETSTLYEDENYDGSVTDRFYFPEIALKLDLRNIHIKGSSVPKLGQGVALSVLMLKLIKHGYYKVGDSLPTFKFLVSRLGVSNASVRHMEDDLAYAGIILYSDVCNKVVDTDDKNWYFTGSLLSNLGLNKIDVGNVVRNSYSLHRNLGMYDSEQKFKRTFTKL